MKTNNFKLLGWIWLLLGGFSIMAILIQSAISSNTPYGFPWFNFTYSFLALVNGVGLLLRKKWSQNLTKVLAVILAVNIFFTMHIILPFRHITDWSHAAQYAFFLLKLAIAVYSLKIAFSIWSLNEQQSSAIESKK
jgi:hypothetical protein